MQSADVVADNIAQEGHVRLANQQGSDDRQSQQAHAEFGDATDDFTYSVDIHRIPPTLLLCPILEQLCENLLNLLAAT